ncbi:MAG: hypothetical protein KDD19_06780 [Phaeodactylibacter sp.]|nr:hypothetical protein [Phaeodactylibacter sp.]MCB9051100.1 hypothetical protein [Lewinellaceae bacterium]
MNRIACLVFLFLALFSVSSPAQRMDNKRMQKIFEKESIQVEGEPGAWMAYFKDYILLVITDEPNNRMRVFTPIIEEEAASPAQMSRMLKANFHSALDAKYSVYEGFVVSVFTHPLKELTEGQLLDALSQVAKLAETFGTTYSSTGLIFDKEEEEIELEEKKPLEKRS